MTRRFHTVASILALAAIYFAAGKFGLSLAFVNASASAVWPPTGIALAVLLLWGYRLWPGIFIGAFLVNITAPGPPEITLLAAVLKTLGVATGNTLEAVLGAWLVQQFAHGLKAFERAGDIFKFVLAAILSTVVSATLGVTSLCVSGYAPWEQYAAIWFTWWLGDLVGALVVAPLLLIWMTQPLPRLKPKRILEAAGLLLALALFGKTIFLDGIPAIARNQFKYLSILPLLWAAFRFGPRGAITSVFVISGVALWGTLHGLGPFAAQAPNQSLLFLQVFVGTIAATALVLGAVISERKKAEQRLQVQHAVSRALAQSPTLKEATPKIFEAFCETGGWQIGAIWNVNRTTNELTCVEVWHVPSLEAPEFETTTRQHRFAPGIGLPGRVWSSGQPVWVPDVTKDRNFPRAAVATKEGLHAAFCFPLKLGDNVVGVIECFSREVREPDDNFLQILGDIGNQLGQFIERKGAEEARQHGEALHGAILDSALDCIISIDQNGNVIEFNPAAEKTFGYTRPEVMGKPMAELIIPPRLREQHYRGLARYLKTGEGPVLGRHIKMSALRRDGSEMPVELSINALRLGREQVFVATLRNITERKKTEAALEEARAKLKAHADELEMVVAERTQELRETIAEVESFSYSISHDMRGPLRAMQGYAAVLEQELKGKIGDEEWRYLGRIVTAAARLNRLVQDILSYSQVSRTKLQLAPVDLQPLLLEVLQQNPNLQSPLAEIRIDGPLPIVLGHEASLVQICSNLLGNAVKFVYPGTTPRLRILAEVENAAARITIADNGIGIDPKNHERVFQMFEQVNSPKDYDGTGIGLAIVKKAVERMGGKIGVQSELGKGSQFWFELRCVSAD